MLPYLPEKRGASGYSVQGALFAAFGHIQHGSSYQMIHHASDSYARFRNAFSSTLVWVTSSAFRCSHRRMKAPFNSVLLLGSISVLPIFIAYPAQNDPRCALLIALINASPYSEPKLIEQEAGSL